MRNLLIGLFFLACSGAVFCQTDSVFTAELRKHVMSIDLAHHDNMKQALELNDSLRVNPKKWQARYDSLMRDTLSLEPEERSIILIDNDLLAYSTQPTLSAYQKVKSNASNIVFRWEGAQNYLRELNAILLEMALEQKDYEMVYRCQNKLHAAYYAEWKKEDAVRIAQLDSLSEALEEIKKSNDAAMHSMSDLAMRWHLAAMVLLGVLVLVILLLFFLKRNWKKQQTNLTAKANDTSEEEVLVVKLEEARREITELRMLAKKKIDEAVIRADIPPVPSGGDISKDEIVQWNDEVQQALMKIKSHCEAGKNSMSVPTYMSIMNDTTRLSAQVSKKSEQWIALLNSKG
jgi:hypothetical protein